MDFDGILFFPVTPFDADGRVETGLLRHHISTTLAHSPGGVFPACGTGEFHALSADEIGTVVSTAVDTVAGAVPVVAGTGGPLGQAIALARAAADAGADGLLLLPPYLVGGPQAGLVAYAEAVAAASDLPVVIYHRGTAQYSVESVRRLAQNPKIVGFKDGTGDIGLAQQIVRAVAETGRTNFAFFNGLLTAELTQGAYRGIGIPLYSSAAFAMVPEVANAYYRAYVDGDEGRRLELLDGFYAPLVRLRDETPGFGVSLIKAGLRLSGLPVGGVRAPLVDPSPAQEQRLGEILEAGRALL
ncbi:5-dehydro-4-deoxyglucarate dehydratase [Microbacterium sp. P02]|uniref:5-dehydro-4-deoxyglucarate dehydratase n=1 Tax=Microbacterium sp. P02 TaxID=3366260 RepID=UPI00366E1641